MKNKIMMIVLLCALLVGLVPPSSAMANDVVYTEEVDSACKSLTPELLDMMNEYPYLMGYDNDISCIVLILWNDSDYPIRIRGSYAGSKYCYGGHKSSGSSTFAQGVTYKYVDGVWTRKGSGASSLKGTGSAYPIIYCSSFDCAYDQNGSVYVDDILPFYEFIGGGKYTFGKWCVDANLNCQASSYESSLVVPYSYNEYVHIVRRTGAGKYDRWILTTIGNSIIGDNLSDYTLMVNDTGELQVYALYSGEEEQGYQLFVRNYVYDTDGWKLISFELFDTREDDDFIIELGEDSAINDVNLLAYTSVDIYDDGLSLLHSASTEYYDVNDILPDVPEEPEEPDVTPTVPPSSGGLVSPLPTVAPPISAGQATVTKNRTAIYEEPSSTSQVQHYLFEGGVVYVVEEYGEDWYYVRYDMGGLSYTGYVAQDNVNYDVDNGFASEDVIDGYEGQVDSLLGMVGNVPKMIYALFSFLPPWCLALVGVSFTAMLALIGWKILRG